MGTKKEWKCIGEHIFTKNTDVLITDPCYLMYGERGESMPLGELESWCKEHGLISRTFYGDWGCTVFGAKSKVGHPNTDIKLGRFCADAGMVCVLDMDDVRARFPDIDKFVEERSWCAAVIKGFCGHVRLMTMTRRMSFKDKEGKKTWYNDTELRIHGVGTINSVYAAFESVQTSM